MGLLALRAADDGRPNAPHWPASRSVPSHDAPATAALDTGDAWAIERRRPTRQRHPL